MTLQLAVTASYVNRFNTRGRGHGQPHTSILNPGLQYAGYISPGMTICILGPARSERVLR
jgi:hypothetical protein